MAALTRTLAVALSALHDNAAGRFDSGAAVERALNAAVRPAACAQRLLLAIPSASPEEQAALCRVLSWLEDGSAEDALLSLLETAPAAAAAAIADRRAPELMARALRGGDSARRLLLLPLLDGKSELASTFLPCLDDPDPAVRVLACSALSSAGDASAVPRLFQLLREEDPGVAQVAVGAIQSLGSPRTEQLALAAARSNDVREQRAGLRILAYFGYASALELLLAAVRSGDQRLRDAAVPGLAFLEDPQALAALLELAQHPQAPARAAAMRALAQSEGTEEALLRLRAGLADRDPWVRYYACQALGRLADRDSAGRILGLMDDPAGQVRVAAVDALSELGGPRALSALLSAAASPNDEELQHAALTGLGRSRSREALQALTAAASSPLARTRLVALSAAARFGGAASIRLLCLGAADADEGVRAAALSLLGAHPAALVQLLRSPDTHDAAAAALTRIGRPAAQAALFEALLSSDVEVRRSAASALSAFDTSEARTALEQAIFDDPDPEVRLLGLTALVH
jgi:HEAT repeat protein